MKWFTFPEDKDPRREAGWGPFKMKYFYWLIGKSDPYQPSVDWHDDITTKGSPAQKYGIPADRVQETFQEQLRVLEKDLPPEWREGKWKWVAHKIRRVYHQVTRKTRYDFYEGPKK